MTNQKCNQCTFFTARAQGDGKLTWGRFCVLPAYRDDLPVVEINAGHVCPLVDDSMDTNNGVDNPKGGPF